MSVNVRLLFVLTTILSVFCATGLAPAGRTPDDASREAPLQGLETHEPSENENGHGPEADCVRCHGDRPEATAPDTAKLVAPVMQLCFACHDEYAALDGWVHGPAATGDCVVCHDPHESEYGSLLTKPVPQLCHDCHTMETLGLVAGHTGESYGRCDACHESHAGTNRRLLKQSFLSSEGGVAYRDTVTSRRPQYTFVDRRRSLVGLQGIRVIPTIERQDLLRQYGVTPEIVKREAERCLRERGVRILSDEGQVARQPGLYVHLRLVELRFPGYSDEVCALSGSVDMFVRQTVELISQPNDAERRLCLATTWDTSAVVVWGTPQVQEGLDNAIKVLLDRFCSDYLAANPSDERPSSGRHATADPKHRLGK